MGDRKAENLIVQEWKHWKVLDKSFEFVWMSIYMDDPQVLLQNFSRGKVLLHGD